MTSIVSRTSLRFVFGIAVSAAFVIATVSRVDIAEVIQALRRVQSAGLVLALVLVCLEIGVRAHRWQALIAPIGSIPYRRCLAYLCIGYFANSLLPARLGDVARAYLAGAAFGIPRMAALGTILVERLTDGIAILLIVIAAGALVSAGDALVTTAAALLVAGSLGALVLIAAGAIAIRTGLAGTRAGVAVRVTIAPILAGTTAIRRPTGLAILAGLTLLAFGLAVAAFGSVAAAVGLDMTPLQAALVMGALALSTAIPAGPGSVGTYEFIGVTVLVSLGFPAEPAFAAVLLVHLLAALPPAVAGLGAFWANHLRVGSLVEQSVKAPLSGPAA